MLANLANFAYDPVNYDYLRQLGIIDLFLHVLSENDKTLVRFAIGGICNLCLGKSIFSNFIYKLSSHNLERESCFFSLSISRHVFFFAFVLRKAHPSISKYSVSDPINKEYISQNQGINLVSSLLTSNDEQTILSAITTLMFLVTPLSKKKITSPQTIEKIQSFSNNPNKRIKNLADIFLSDYCSQQDLEQAKEIPNSEALENIPLPVGK